MQIASSLRGARGIGAVATLAAQLSLTIPASAISLGLEPGSGPTLRVTLFATDGFTSETPIQENADRPYGGFANTEEVGVLQPVLLLNGIGYSWESLSYSGVLGVAVQPVDLHISEVSVSWSNSGGSLNASPLPLGGSTVIKANQRAGTLAGTLEFGLTQLAFSIDLDGFGNLNAAPDLFGENPVDFNRLRIAPVMTAAAEIVPLTTQIGTIGGIDFSLAVHAADLNPGSVFDTAYQAVPEPSTATLLGLGLLLACAAGGGRGLTRVCDCRGLF